MPSFSDSIVLFILALMLFGPKRLPKLAREIGKWVGEFRRASNEFKMQMDDELRLVEQADRQKEIAAMQAAAPVTPVIPEPEHPHLPPTTLEAEPLEAQPLEAQPLEASAEPDPPTPAAPAYEIVDGVRTPILPIATSGELKIMPPSTGLPQQRGRSALSGLLDAIPATDSNETAAHGD
jgi:sec-independent protein translocase protein TatB